MTDWYFSSSDPFPTHSDSKSFKSREDNLEKSFYRLMNLFFLRWLNSPEWTDILQGAVTQRDVCCCIRDKSSSLLRSSFSSCRIIYATTLTANRCTNRTANHFWFITGDGSKGHTSRHLTFFMENIPSGSQPDQTVLPWRRSKLQSFFFHFYMILYGLLMPDMG